MYLVHILPSLDNSFPFSDDPQVSTEVPPSVTDQEKTSENLMETEGLEVLTFSLYF
jgi:hypothetical protein